jgi:hypothetical protein
MSPRSAFSGSLRQYHRCVSELVVEKLAVHRAGR